MRKYSDTILIVLVGVAMIVFDIYVMVIMFS